MIGRMNEYSIRGDDVGYGVIECIVPGGSPR